VKEEMKDPSNCNPPKAIIEKYDPPPKGGASKATAGETCRSSFVAAIGRHCAGSAKGFREGGSPRREAVAASGRRL